MMKQSSIKDALQVALALLITGGTALAMAPPQKATHPVTKIVQAQKPKSAIRPVEALKTAAETPKAIIWQDNPNHCTDNQYIAKEAPFKCISKPASQPAIPHVATVLASGSCGDNEYAHYIYTHESGCNPAAVNHLGCRGIGQACPGSKLPCGADYACQNAWFTNYANQYGGWYGAYKFWLAHHWW